LGLGDQDGFELYLDGFLRTSNTAAATSTSALFGINRWGWASRRRRTSRRHRADRVLRLILDPAMARRWHADHFGFLRPWNEVPAYRECATRHAPLDRHRRGHLPDGVESCTVLS
jgi:hypothetical protein